MNHRRAKFDSNSNKQTFKGVTEWLPLYRLKNTADTALGTAKP